MTDDSHMPLEYFRPMAAEEMIAESRRFAAQLRQRRTVRDFAPDPIPRDVIDQCIWAAGSAPSGANQQPWTFAVVEDPDLKHQIREAAETEEQAFYEGRAGDVWLETLQPLGTYAEKPFLETAPVLIAIFEQKYRRSETGERIKHYYSKESVGIATGMLITALHLAGLVTLTHTPSPMNFLNDILDRPEGERAFLLLVVGYPARDALVPRLEKRPIEDLITRY